MQKKTWPVTVFTLVAGALTMFLRWLQIRNTFNEETGLVSRGSALSIAVITVCVISVAAIFAFTLSLRDSVRKENFPILPHYHNILQPVVAALACLLLFAGSLILLVKGVLPYKIVAALLMASSAALAKLSLSKNDKTKRGVLAALGSIPPLAVCVLLVVEYRFISKEPQLWLYAPRILAYAAAALGFYYIAGFPFGRANPLAAIFVTQLAGFLCLAATAACPRQHAGASLILAAFAIILILESWSIIASMTARRRQH